MEANNFFHLRKLQKKIITWFFLTRVQLKIIQDEYFSYFREVNSILVENNFKNHYKHTCKTLHRFIMVNIYQRIVS